jgi:hypothetical protein
MCMYVYKAEPEMEVSEMEVSHLRWRCLIPPLPSMKMHAYIYIVYIHIVYKMYGMG